jgi:hypothetical protein
MIRVNVLGFMSFSLDSPVLFPRLEYLDGWMVLPIGPFRQASRLAPRQTGGAHGLGVDNAVLHFLCASR